MDINTIRAGVTVAALITFLGIVAWAWSSRRRADFDAAARIPLDEDDAATPGEKQQ